MANLKVDYTIFEEEAKNVLEISNRIDEVRDKIVKETGSIYSCWEGDAAAAFSSMITSRFIPVVNNIYEYCQAMSGL
ncbi:MAG: WXG100 family type VII secretion target, partial [Lachnospiraceae bacterium]|nr:WXG100 family type VII secretion target [Lachnospiraceae bacterium]